MNKYLIKLKIRHLTMLILEIAILIVFLSFFIITIKGVVGNPNATVVTYLTVGQVSPEVLNVSIDEDNSSITLNPNSTKVVRCVALIRDYNNQTDINNITAEFYSNGSSYGAADDKNKHYMNTTCVKNDNFVSWHSFSDDVYHTLANCTFAVEYYADPVSWNCTVFVNDSTGWNSTNNDTILMSELIAIALPDSISYGTVNATYMSLENFTNVSNAGNVDLNLSLKGWAVNQGDNLAMNCTQGAIRNISIEHEKYNLTNSASGELTLAQSILNYTNLSSTAVIKKFELKYRQQDSYNEATNATYWRIYVPIGVAGNCSGNIQFGATKAAGT